eukprot:2428919-Prymnesium_polylepis.1
MTILQRRTLPDPVSALRHAIRQSVRGRTEQLLFQQQQQAQQQQFLVDQLQAQLQQQAQRSSGASAFTATGGAPLLPPSLGAAPPVAGVAGGSAFVPPVTWPQASATLETAAVPRQLASALAAVGGGASTGLPPSGPPNPSSGLPGMPPPPPTAAGVPGASSFPPASG